MCGDNSGGRPSARHRSEQGWGRAAPPRRRLQALIDVVLPVFLVIGAGYASVRAGYFSDIHVEALMKYAQGFAIPCLLFRAIWTLDLGAGFDAALLFSFYAGALSGFFAGFAAARFLFGRSLEDAIAIGFACLFSNSVLMGLPLTERAFGPEALVGNYAIIALHAPFCYFVGVTAMELARASGTGRAGGETALRVLRGMFGNALVIGIMLGFAFNLTGISLPGAVTDAVDMIVRTGLPVALFGLGGILVRYKPQGDMRVILTVCAISLVLHPTVTFALTHLLGVPLAGTRSAVLTAAMAPGVNAYIFSNLYGAAQRVAASSVLFATGLNLLTAWAWLHVLP